MSEPRGATSIVAWIGQTVERYGNSVAATGVGETLTFDELWSRSMRLASELVARGVRPEDRVGIWAEQSSDLLVGFVGIMAAGAAYVPLDPSYPKERLERIATDAGLRLVVVPHRHREGAGALGLGLVATTFEASDAGAPVDLPVLDEHLAAYVIFTSGSTGRPKGVVIEHAALASTLRWLIEDCDLHPGDRVMGTASPAYDASVPTFFLPLVTGGTLISLASEVTVDPYALAEAIAHYRPRAMQTSPTMLQMLAETGWEGDPRLDLWVGGDQIKASSIRYIVPRVHELCNYYGPTEATVEVTVARLTAEDTDAPVGRPPDHVGCYVLDPDRRRVPSGTAGELFLTGPTLARGYLDRPELTAERFVSLSLDGAPPVRAYRTGDLARFRDDGSLLILGRLDDQIKIRGYLVEPREVEVRLMEHPQVHDAAVLAVATGEDERRLVAYVRSEGAPSARSLRAFVRQALPEHMVPTTIIDVASLPLTSNGKVDRKQLAERLVAEEASSTAPPLGRSVTTAPATPEAAVLELFASALSVPACTLDVDDDFFEVGGTSLRCARLFLSIEERYGVTLPLSTLVDAPTPRLLSKVIAAEEKDGASPRAHADPPRHEWERILGSLWSETLMSPGHRTDRRLLRARREPRGRAADARAAARRRRRHRDPGRAAPRTDDRAARRVDRGPHGAIEPRPTEDDRHEPAVLLHRGCRWARGHLHPAREAPRSRAALLRPAGQGHRAPRVPRLHAPGHGTPVRTADPRRAADRAVPHRRPLLGRRDRPEGGAPARGPGRAGVAARGVRRLLTEAMVGSSVAADVEPRQGAGRLSDLPRRPRLKTVLRLPMAGIVPQHGIAQFEVFAALGQLQVAFARRLEPWDGTAVVFVSDDEESGIVAPRWSKLLTGTWSTCSVPGQHIRCWRSRTSPSPRSTCASRSPRSSTKDVAWTATREARPRRTPTGRRCPRHADDATVTTPH